MQENYLSLTNICSFIRFFEIVIKRSRKLRHDSQNSGLFFLGRKIELWPTVCCTMERPKIKKIPTTSFHLRIAYASPILLGFIFGRSAEKKGKMGYSQIYENYRDFSLYHISPFQLSHKFIMPSFCQWISDQPAAAADPEHVGS